MSGAVYPDSCQWFIQDERREGIITAGLDRGSKLLKLLNFFFDAQWMIAISPWLSTAVSIIIPLFSPLRLFVVGPMIGACELICKIVCMQCL